MYFNNSDKEFIRKAVKIIIKTTRNTRIKANSEFEVLKELRKKYVFYTKADKGNAMVIIDKNKYHKRMNNLSNDSSMFQKLKKIRYLVGLNKRHQLYQSITAPSRKIHKKFERTC